MQKFAKLYILFVLSFGLCHFCTPAYAQDSLQNVQIIDTTNRFPILYQYVLQAVDSTEKIEFENRNQLNFNSTKLDTVKNIYTRIGINTHKWLYTSIYSVLPTDKEVFLFVGSAELAEVYVQYADGKIVKSITGQSCPSNLRDIKQDGRRVRFAMPKQQLIKIWIHYHSYGSNRNVFVKISDPTLQTENYFNNYFWHSIMQGAFWIMIFYNFILFIILKDKAYFFYTLYILFATLFIAFIFIPQEFPFIGNFLQHKYFLHFTFIAHVPLFYMLFIKYFVRADRDYPSLGRFTNIYTSIRFFINFVMMICLWAGMGDYWFTVLTNVILLFDIAAGAYNMVVIAKKDVKSILNRFVLFGTLCLLLGGAIDTLRVFLPFFTAGSDISFFPIGAISQILILSFGLANRSKMIEMEKQQAQAELIAQLKNNEELQQNINRDLEIKVKERTIEIAHKNEELETQSSLLQAQKNDLEHAYTHITDSVRYAKRIQTAMLPPKNKLQDLFPNSFILYKPKDIVSGDFYFCAYLNPENTNHTPTEIIFAVADCTGHGVPGAFMTVIGNNLLDKIINENKITNPAQILTELDKNLLQTLQQQTTENSKNKVNDGMDIALVKIDILRQEITLCSAKRPIYQFANGELIEHKANKFPIGSSHFGEKIFEQKTIHYQKSDVFYLFTDGYADQFGGEEGRKFMVKHFKTLVSNVHNLPFAEQEQILNTTIEEWKGETAQTDDILVVGIRL